MTELDGSPVGVVLRAASSNGSHHRAAICNLCHTQQPADQVVMFSARRAGAAGERGDSVGTYMCSDLMCQETVRLGRPAAPSEVLPSVHELERIEGLARRTRRSSPTCSARRGGGRLESARQRAASGASGSSVGRFAVRPSPDDRPVSRRPIHGSTNSR